MTFAHNDIVLHTIDNNAIGIVQHGEVEWWNIQDDRRLLIGTWSVHQYGQYLKPISLNTITIQIPPNFAQRVLELRGFPIRETNKDSPVVRKIKELDYKWELKMKAKGNFFLTSPALSADQKTTSQSTQMGTATASAATFTSLLRGSIQQYQIRIDNCDF